MPFRSTDAPSSFGGPADPFARFVELYEALDHGKGYFADRVPLRFAACTLLTTPGDAKAIAERIEATDAALRARLSIFSSFHAPLRLMTAAMLVKAGDTADNYMNAAEHFRELLRAHQVRKGSSYEYVAALVLHRLNNGRPITDAQVVRFKALYDAMKRYHFWLTGPDDFPACALLVPAPGTPQEIGDRIEAIYQALRTEADLWRGEALQTAANVLVLAGLEPLEAARRFRDISEAFAKRGVKIRQSEYDEVSVLCFLAQPLERIVDAVLAYRTLVGKQFRWLGSSFEFSLGASLSFVRLCGDHETLGPLSDAKLLLDMQTIIAARQASS